MMEIIVQVLPNIIKKSSDPKEFKKSFVKNFVKFAKEFIETEDCWFDWAKINF